MNKAVGTSGKSGTGGQSKASRAKKTTASKTGRAPKKATTVPRKAPAKTTTKPVAKAPVKPTPPVEPAAAVKPTVPKQAPPAKEITEVTETPNKDDYMKSTEVEKVSQLDMSYRDMCTKVKYVLEDKSKGLMQAEMYVLQPYFISLGYDLYNIKETTVDFDIGFIRTVVTKDLNAVMSLSAETPDQENDRVFISIDIDRMVMALKCKVLEGSWETIAEITLQPTAEKKEEASNADNDYRAMAKFASKSLLTKGYTDLKEKYLTQGVLDTKLAHGDWNNAFLVNALSHEFVHPSDAMIALIATQFNKTYTQQSVEDIIKQLAPIKDEGLYSVLERLNDRSPNSLRTSFSNSVPTFAQPKKENSVPEVVTPVDEKEKAALTDLGFGEAPAAAAPEPEAPKAAEAPLQEADAVPESTPTPVANNQSLADDGSFNLDSF